MREGLPIVSFEVYTLNMKYIMMTIKTSPWL
jgi:hypothetical protein